MAGRGRGRGAPAAAAAPAAAEASQGTELASKLISCELKRVFVDLKENAKGKFLKISEQDVGGQRSKIVLPISGVSRFRQILESLSELDKSLGPAEGDGSLPEGGPPPPLKSESFRAENKMFYFDLRHNAKGRYVKISQVLGQRTTIVVPAGSLAQLHEAINEVCSGDAEAAASAEPVVPIPADQLPAAVQVTAGQKRFFFDVGSNPRGVFLRVSEVVGSYRTSITVPQSGWAQMRDTLQSYIDQMDRQQQQQQQ